ncbi:MAG: DUF4250 domain-containing protein [Coprobacillus sp.]
MLPKDPIILLSYINTKLRDQYDSLEWLCEDLDIDKKDIEEKLKLIDYIYDRQENQFK